MREEELREKIVRIAHALDRAGLCPSKSGNVSARFRDGLLITPSGLPYAVMRPADIVELPQLPGPLNSALLRLSRIDRAVLARRDLPFGSSVFLAATRTD